MSLGELLRSIKGESNNLDSLTVMSAQIDPFRLDTPTNHANGAWFRDQMQACGLLDRENPIHNRGIHYAIVSRGDAKLPSGLPYKNDADCWAFLEERASKAARWLGYVPFDRIIDARNAAPIIRIQAEVMRPGVSVDMGSLIKLPDVEILKPQVVTVGFAAKQKYRLVLFGEKTSLGEVLEPLADAYGADLYLPSGEISDTLPATMAKTGAEDGRPMVVFVIADCDPAGYQMAVSIGHKLRALKEAFYPSLTFQLHAPCLTVEQVRRFDLPSTPLKETELRAAGWRNRYGVEQTEVDALATLRPELLKEIVEAALDPYFDDTLEDRLGEVKSAFEVTAQEKLDEQLDGDLLEDIREKAEAALESAREQIGKLGEIEISLDLTPPELPAAEPPESGPDPLVDSAMDLATAIGIMRARKDYKNGGGA